MREPVARLDRPLTWRVPSAQDYLAGMLRVDGILVFAIGGGAPREPMLTTVPTLDALADDPGKASDLPPAAARALYVRAVLAMSALLPLILAPHGERPEPAPPEPDRLLTPDEAATMLGVSKVWLYRHAPRLTFARRLSRKTLRFSERGLLKYQAAKRP